MLDAHSRADRWPLRLPRGVAVAALLMFAQCGAAPGVPALVATTSITMNMSPGAFAGSFPAHLAEALVVPSLGLRCVVSFTGKSDPERQWALTVTEGAWTRDDEPHRERTMLPQDLADRLIEFASAETPSQTECHSLAAALVQRGVVARDPLDRVIRYQKAR